MTELEPRFLHNGKLIPPKLVSTVANWWIPSELTSGWLDGLPDSVQKFTEKWDITFDPDIPISNVTFVLLGHSSKLGPVVYKSSPIKHEFESEAAALRIAGGENVSRLFDMDLERSAMIIERIVPGNTLLAANLPDEEATHLFANLAMQFWREVPEPAGLHPLRTWMQDLYDWKSRPDFIPDETIELAHRLGEELLDSPTPSRLTHGDLHHQNILRRTSGDWAIIDPKGIFGDPAFEIATWMYNPPGIANESNYLDLARRRIDICSEVWGIGHQHLVRWAFVGAVLSAVWSASGADGPDIGDWGLGTLKIAEVMKSFM